MTTMQNGVGLSEAPPRSKASITSKYSGLEHLVAATFFDGAMAMLTVYFDDSGTHDSAQVAIAAGYISSVEQWNLFADDWKQADSEEHFGVLHMADFNRVERAQLLERLIGIIGRRAQRGFAVAIPKDAYDGIVQSDPKLKNLLGEYHYTFAVKFCLSYLNNWMTQHAPGEELRYVFDWMDKKGKAKSEISTIFDNWDDAPPAPLGLGRPVGISFERKELVPPLQAADVLAWHTYKTMVDCILPNSPEKQLPSTTLLERGPLTTAYFTLAELNKWCDDFKQQDFYKNLNVQP